MSPSLHGSVRRGVLVALALLLAPMIATADAQAAVSLGVTPNIPAAGGAVTVGQSVPSSLELQNLSTGPEAVLNVTINTITLVPSCGTTQIGADCPIGFSDPDVFSLSATGTGRVGTGCAGLTFSIVDVDQLQDKYQFIAASTVVLGPAANGGAAARCSIDFTVSVLKVPTIDARTDLPGVQTSNHAWADATASSGQPGAAAGTNITHFIPAQPTISTNASAPVTLGGGTLTDTAVVTGRVNPTANATVTFTLYAPGDVTCTGPQLFTSTKPYPVGPGSVTSNAFTPTSAGTHRWVASYSGDANNSPAVGPCNAANESTIVTAPASPTIATTATPFVLLVGNMTDKATVGGRINPVGGAMVTFRLYGPTDPGCSGTPLFISTVGYAANGGTATSAPFTPTKSGTYHWIASYSGDVNNLPVSGSCNDSGESTFVVLLFG